MYNFKGYDIVSSDQIKNVPLNFSRFQDIYDNNPDSVDKCIKFIMLQYREQLKDFEKDVSKQISLRFSNTPIEPTNYDVTYRKRHLKKTSSNWRK